MDAMRSGKASKKTKKKASTRQARRRKQQRHRDPPRNLLESFLQCVGVVSPRLQSLQQKATEEGSGGQGSCRDPSPMPAYPRSHQWLPASSTFHARLSSMASRVANSNWDYRGAAPRSDTSLQMRAGTLQQRGWLLTHWEWPSTPSTRCRCATWLTAW